MQQKPLRKELPELISGCEWQQIFKGCSTSEVFRLERAGNASFYLKTALRVDSDLANEKQILD